MKNVFKIGDRVKSNFRARWKGEVINIEPRSDKLKPLITVLVDTDRNGRPLRKKIKKTLDQGWLTLIS